MSFCWANVLAELVVSWPHVDQKISLKNEHVGTGICYPIRTGKIRQQFKKKTATVSFCQKSPALTALARKYIAVGTVMRSMRQDNYSI
jgi:hypothetical protein